MKLKIVCVLVNDVLAARQSSAIGHLIGLKVGMMVYNPIAEYVAV
jgi:hypothetical protein